VDILMPQLGETVAEGKITTWFKKVGDPVKPGDNLFEIETDKVSMEVPATSAGVLSEIRVAAGAVAPVGAVVAVVAGAGGATTSPQAAATGAPPKAPPSPARVPAPAAAAIAAAPAKPSGPMDPFFEVRTPERNFGPARTAAGSATSPLARRLAGTAGIDLSRVKGSGPHGRIVAKDVERAISSGQVSAPAAAGAALAAGPTLDQVRALYKDVAFDELPVDGMRRTIAARLTQAKQTIPHFYLTADVELDRLMALREQANAGAHKDGSGNPAYKLSVNDFVIKALALALQHVPAANAVWAEDRILRFRQSDVGVAVALDGGLITPVIRNAQAKSLSAISTEMKELADRARAKKLKPDEYQGGATAVSNLGMYGVREFAAIINPPHATILAVGAGQRRPVEVADGGVKFVSQMIVTLSCDHRVVDGALGAQLLAAFRGLIENPLTMLV
jgi:pyruvate dehydrogenase E2 component (dihydrolipoamide acetyltransferase)